MARKRKGTRVYGPYEERGRWRVVLVGEDGRRVTKILASEAAALDVVTAARKKIEGEVWIDDALAKFEKHLAGTGIAPVSVYTSMRRLRTLVEPFADSLARLTPAAAERLYGRMRERRRPDGSSYSVDYHRNSLSTAKRFGAWCVKRGWLRRNPFAEVEGIGKRNRGKPQLTIDEARKLYQLCLEDPSPEATAVLCCLVLGMRATEVAMLQARQIDDGGRILRIERATTKTDAGARVLGLPAALRDRLLSLAEVGRLFPGRTRYWVYHHCRRLCRAAGVSEVTPHGMRGTHATLATEAGITGPMVAAALGHENETVTQNHYIQPGATEQAQRQRALQVLQGGRS